MPVPVNDTLNLKARILKDGEWSALTEANFTVSGSGPEPASADNLAISEIHYHPLDATLEELSAGFTDDGEFEYFEVRNVGNLPVSLEGISMAQGLDLTTVEGAVDELAPGTFAIYVANPDAFVYRYGSGFPIAGRFDLDTSLNNGGERLHLKAQDGSTIVDFTYDDKAPWPVTPDGYGPSLVLMQAGSRDPSLSWNWRPSEDMGGTPGADAIYLTYEAWAADAFQPSDPGYPTIALAGADPDEDGLSNVEELFYGTDPWAIDDESKLPKLTLETIDPGTGPATYAVFTFRYNREAEGVLFTVNASMNLEDWSTDKLILIEATDDHGDGMETRRYRSLQPIDGSLIGLYCSIFLESP
jgi:hypothetical protein